LLLGRATAEAIAREELENIKQYDRKLNAFITIFDGESEPALERAREVDSLLGDGKHGEDSLFGAPVVIKDDFFLSGYRTTNACFAFRNFVPSSTAMVVERLLRAGMVPLGKTNMHELALGATSSSSFYGPVRNPHDPNRISGGSSGGTAVAVAASRHPLLGLGTDAGGSVRTPAALCGICGFKPSLGMLSTEGAFPLSATLDHTGIMTRTMEDMLIAFRAIVDTNRLPGRGERRPRLRVGIPNAHFANELHERVSKEFWRAVDRLRTLDDLEVIEGVRFPSASKINASRTTIQIREAAWFYEEIVRSENLRQRMHADVLSFLDAGSKIGMLEYMHANRARAELIGEMSAIFEEVDFLLMPTCLTVAPRLEEVQGMERGSVRRLLIANTEPFNLCGFPALTVPASRDAGLPVGLQIVGGYTRDAQVLELGNTAWQALH